MRGFLGLPASCPHRQWRIHLPSPGRRAEGTPDKSSLDLLAQGILELTKFGDKQVPFSQVLASCRLPSGSGEDASVSPFVSRGHHRAGQNQTPPLASLPEAATPQALCPLPHSLPLEAVVWPDGVGVDNISSGQESWGNSTTTTGEACSGAVPTGEDPPSGTDPTDGQCPSRKAGPHTPSRGLFCPHLGAPAPSSVGSSGQPLLLVTCR